MKFVVLAVAALLLLVGCASTQAPAAAWPNDVHGGWKLRERSPLPPDTAPGFVRALGLKQAWQVVYEGPTTVRMEAFEMSSSAGAFEAAQKWRRDGERSPLNKNTFFLLIRQDQQNQNTLSEFVTAFSKAF